MALVVRTSRQQPVPQFTSSLSDGQKKTALVGRFFRKPVSGWLAVLTEAVNVIRVYVRKRNDANRTGQVQRVRELQQIGYHPLRSVL